MDTVVRSFRESIRFHSCPGPTGGVLAYSTAPTHLPLVDEQLIETPAAVITDHHKLH